MIRVTITELEVRESPPTAAKPWKRVGIKTSAHGDKWVGAFVNKYNERGLMSLKSGMTVDLIVGPSEDGKYLNFRLPSRTDRIEQRLSVVEQKLGIGGDQVSPSGDINPDDIPF